ncbi:MAG: hypothetical protein GXP32_10540 [Kiritimatiellaeota bacterium]|nr:hypothetical protein [Kiritimatiellota bacterium]
MNNNAAQSGLKCPLCGGTKCLTQIGILKIYLLAVKFPVVLMVVGLFGGGVYSKYMLVLTVIGLLYPIAMADLRIYLYPVAAIACLFGKKLNCPKCEPHCSMFRHG